MRLLRPLLLAFALLFSQHAAMLHGLAHAEHELALATQGDKAPALDHGADVCAAFGALAHALGNASAAPAAHCIHGDSQSVAAIPALVLTRVAYDSRAPPFSA